MEIGRKKGSPSIFDAFPEAGLRNVAFRGYRILKSAVSPAP